MITNVVVNPTTIWHDYDGPPLNIYIYIADVKSLNINVQHYIIQTILRFNRTGTLFQLMSTNGMSIKFVNFDYPVSVTKFTTRFTHTQQQDNT